MEEQIKKPDHFVLRGAGHHHKDVHIGYSTTGITGKPSFSYEDSKGSHSFTGDAIAREETKMGTAVTVTLDPMGTNLRFTTLTLLIPLIDLEDSGANLKTIAIKTVNQLPGHVITPVGPGGKLGKEVLQSYEVIDLKGKANLVYF